MNIKRNDPCPRGSGKKHKECRATDEIIATAPPAAATPPRNLAPEKLAACMQLAIKAHQEGNLLRAEAIYRQALAYNPANADALHLLGVIAFQVNRLTEAESLIRRAIQISPGSWQFHESLGKVLLIAGSRTEAINSYYSALRLNPQSASAYNDLSVALLDEGKLAEAEAMARRATNQAPNNPNAHYNLGNVLNAQMRFAEAVEAYKAAIRLDPNYAKAYNNLGNALESLGRYEEAAQSYRNAIRALPDYIEARNNLGNALASTGRLDEAAACYQEAVEHLAAGSAAGRCDGGQSDSRSAVESASAPIDMDEQQGLLRAATHMNLALALLAQGDFSGGLSHYEWRWKLNGISPPSFAQPRWDGRPLHERALLLYEEQGFGDTIHFIRYAGLIKDRFGGSGCRIIVRCRRPIKRLLSSCRYIDQLVLPDEPLPDFDFHAPLMSLPLIMGTTVETIPAPVPYLSVEPALAARWRERLPGNRPDLRVGICWQGNPQHKRDRERSFNLSATSLLAEVEGVQLVSLQWGAGCEQLDECPPALREKIAVVEEYNRRDCDFMDMAALLVNLDLVIGPDTAIIHLAGALDLPVWAALAFSADWRWLLNREDSPWYPSMQLFRQAEPGNWSRVFARMRDQLKGMINSDSAHRSSADN